MKSVSFLGSPRLNGNTAALLNAVIDGMKSTGDIENEYIFLQEKKISPCNGCNGCKKNDSGRCVVNDEMQDIYPIIERSDIIILATPIYWWSVTAQMKLLIDRLYGMSFKCGTKKVALLMTYGGELPNSGPETTEALFREICGYLKMEVAGVLGVCSENIHVRDNTAALADGFQLGLSLM